MFFIEHCTAFWYPFVLWSTLLNAYPTPEDTDPPPPPPQPCVTTNSCNPQSVTTVMGPNSAAITSASEASVHFGEDSLAALSNAEANPKPHATENGGMLIENQSKGSIDLPAKCQCAQCPCEQSATNQTCTEEKQQVEKSDKPKKLPCKKKPKPKPTEKESTTEEEGSAEDRTETPIAKEAPTTDASTTEAPPKKPTEKPAAETTKTTPTPTETTSSPTETTSSPAETTPTPTPESEHPGEPESEHHDDHEQHHEEGHVDAETISIPLGPHVQIHLRPGQQQDPLGEQEESHLKEDNIHSLGEEHSYQNYYNDHHDDHRCCYDDHYHDHHDDHGTGTNHRLDITVHHMGDPHEYHGNPPGYYGYGYHDEHNHHLDYRDGHSMDPHEAHQVVHDADVHPDLPDHGVHMDEHIPFGTHPDPHDPHDHLDVHNPVEHFDPRDPHQHVAPTPERTENPEQSQVKNTQQRPQPVDQQQQQQPPNDIVHHTSVYYPHDDYPPVYHHMEPGDYYHPAEVSYSHHPEEGYHHEQPYPPPLQPPYAHYPEDGHLHYPGEQHLFPPGATHPHHPDDGHGHQLNYNHSDVFSHYQTNDEHKDKFYHKDDVSQNHVMPPGQPDATIAESYYNNDHHDDHAPDGHHHPDPQPAVSPPYYQNWCAGCYGGQTQYDPNCATCYDYHYHPPPPPSLPSPAPSESPSPHQPEPERHPEPEPYHDHPFHGGGDHHDDHHGVEESQGKYNVHYHTHNYGDKDHPIQPIIALSPGCCPMVFPTTKPPATTHAPVEELPVKMHWAYKETETAYGPDNWYKLAPFCKGSRQSPIDLVSSTSVPKPLDSDITLSGLEVMMRGKLSNNGKTIGFTIDNSLDNNDDNDDEFIKLTLQGNSYALKQFHFHFSCDGPGSEHAIDGKNFGGEIHFVFQNEKYPIQETALKQADGLAILAFFLKVSPVAETNQELERLSNNMVNVQNPSDELPMPAGLSLPNMVPQIKNRLKTLQRFLYKGSLPTPPCYESVTWVVFKKPIAFHQSSVKNFNTAKNDEGTPLCGNVRPLQDVSDRQVLYFVPGGTLPTERRSTLKRTSTSTRRWTTPSARSATAKSTPKVWTKPSAKIVTTVRKAPTPRGG